MHTGVRCGRLKRAQSIMHASFTYMPEVNGGDKIIWPLFASQCCDLDESMVNCPWVQWPVLVTENLHTKNELISLEQMSSLSM